MPTISRGILKAWVLAGLMGFLSLAGPFAAHAKWRIEYSDWLVNAMGRQGHFVAKHVGSYKNSRECEDARQQALRQSGDPSLDRHMQCVGSDDAPHPAKSGPAAAPAQPAADIEKQKTAEKQKQDAFNRQKALLLKNLKGVPSNAADTKAHGEQSRIIGLKAPPDPPASNRNAADAMDKDRINRRIEELRRQIVGLQNHLRVYSKSLHGNRTEFEKWAATVGDAYDEVLESSKEYVMQMFLKYNLFGALERNVQKDIYGQLGAYLNTGDPAARNWLLEQASSHRTQFERLEKVVAAGNLSGDFAAFLTGEPEETKKNLDALLLVNSLLESGGIVKYEKMLQTSRIFKGLPGEYFEQARMIGETYANLAAIGYSWYAINKLSEDVDRYSAEIDSLSYRMRQAMQEMNCLKGCLADTAAGCMDRCAGKTRLSTPPPLPR